MERDDGFIYVGDPSDYFAPYREWPRTEKRALRFVRGRVLDVGCGAGRVALVLQEKGLEVVAIDESPLAVEVARRRGVRDARPLGLADVDESLGPFDTVLIVRNNVGLAGTGDAGRRLLRRLHALTTRARTHRHRQRRPDPARAGASGNRQAPHPRPLPRAREPLVPLRDALAGRGRAAGRGLRLARRRGSSTTARRATGSCSRRVLPSLRPGGACRSRLGARRARGRRRASATRGLPRAGAPPRRAVIAIRFRTVAPSAAPSDATASIRPYIEASRTPSPDGAMIESTATIAPTALTPPRNGIAVGERVGVDRTKEEEEGRAADDPRHGVVREQTEHRPEGKLGYVRRPDRPEDESSQPLEHGRDEEHDDEAARSRGAAGAERPRRRPS